VDDRTLAIRFGETASADAAAMSWPSAVEKLVL
jgi:hypothetical protein